IGCGDFEISRRCPLYPQKRTFIGTIAMSAKGQKRTHAVQQLGSLLDHLVGERQKIHRQLDARGLCGLEVNDELVVRRLLERQISRPRAAQDACGEAGSALHASVRSGPYDIKPPSCTLGTSYS